MFAANPSHQVRPIGVLLGGSGMRRIVEPKKPDVGVLLKCTDLCASRSAPMDVVAPPPWEADCHDLDCGRYPPLERSQAIPVLSRQRPSLTFGSRPNAQEAMPSQDWLATVMRFIRRHGARP